VGCGHDEGEVDVHTSIQQHTFAATPVQEVEVRLRALKLSQALGGAPLKRHGHGRGGRRGMFDAARAAVSQAID